MDGRSDTPSAEYLFQINLENPVKLVNPKAQFFHHFLAKILFLFKRDRPDLRPVVAFLCTGLKKPDTDDYNKPRKMIQYLQTTPNLWLTLEANSLHLIKCYIDASYEVHPDMRIHTGGSLSLVKEVIYGTSARQKINTKISTEAELVGMSDVMSQVLWTQYFMEDQG